MGSVLLATYPFVHEAWLASHRLEAVGIPSRVSSLRAGLFGMVPAADAVCELWVAAELLDDARRVLSLEVIDGGQAHRQDPSECPRCGAVWEPGFQQCWSCSAVL